MNHFLQEFWNFLFKRHDHPVYKREANGWSYIKFWKGLRRGCLPLMFLAILLPASCVGLYGLFIVLDDGTIPPLPAALGVVTALLFVVLIMSGLIEIAASFLALLLSATTISSEIEAETFILMRVSTVPVQEVVLAKYSAAVRQIYPVYQFITLIRILVSMGLFVVIVGFLVMILTPEFIAAGIIGGLVVLMSSPFLLLYILMIVAVLIFSGLVLTLVFYFQPLFNMLFYNAVGVLGSAYARTRSQGIFTAIGFRIVLWGISYTVSFVINNIIQIVGILVALVIQEITWLSDLVNNNPGLLIVGGAWMMTLWYLSSILVPLGTSIIFLRMAIARTRKLPYRV